RRPRQRGPFRPDGGAAWRRDRGRLARGGDPRAEDGARGLVPGRASVLRLKPVDGHPGAVEAVLLAVEEPLCTGPQALVERRLLRIVLAGRQHAIGDRPRDDRVANAFSAEPAEVPVRI